MSTPYHDYDYQRLLAKQGKEIERLKKENQLLRDDATSDSMTRIRRLCKLTSEVAEPTIRAKHLEAQIEEIQERLDLAMQGDLENGVAWMNKEAAQRFKKDYPALSETLRWIGDLD